MMPHETWATKFGLRPVVYGRRGMVATANPLATLAGVRMLAAGGNAVDAIVAAAAAIGVAEPYMSGLAGCGTLVLTPPGEAPRVLMFLGRAPGGATPDRFPAGPPDAGYVASAVPGNLAGWARVLADYGKLSLAHVLEPAIELAERGVPFTPFDHQMFSESSGRLTREGIATYLHDGRIPAVGSLLVQPDLARTFRQIAAHGIEHLYGGPLGREIDRLMRARGGLLTLEDLRRYPATLRWSSPIQTTYRGVTVYAPPPPTSAIQVLETLNVLPRRRVRPGWTPTATSGIRRSSRCRWPACSPTSTRGSSARRWSGACAPRRVWPTPRERRHTEGATAERRPPTSPPRTRAGSPSTSPTAWGMGSGAGSSSPGPACPSTTRCTGFRRRPATPTWSRRARRTSGRSRRSTSTGTARTAASGGRSGRPGRTGSSSPPSRCWCTCSTSGSTCRMRSPRRGSDGWTTSEIRSPRG
ncbi:MAG: hypothetical protein E6H02_10720 [Bacillati bacterium ANGP1]|uniref:Gamma-glutamyltransferase family protein n=1 Tax=Candidatus Segetimicrobium genomatis TaxID=2569760 RepID=A0A537LIT7_9BACT|nr:MAG: hypothetical protein E6H02_10720 [Terrabacteria group bacterium ANGP1]